MKKAYVKPTVVINGDVVSETRNSLRAVLKPHWPYPEGENYAFIED